MPLWAESRIHGDVYVRFGGRLSETYHRKVAWRRQPSLQVESRKVDEDTRALREMSAKRPINLYEEEVIAKPKRKRKTV